MSHRTWTTEQEEQLREFTRKKKSIAYMSKKLHASRGAIYGKLKRLGLQPPQHF